MSEYENLHNAKDLIKVNMNIYDIPILIELINKLKEENERLENALTIAVDTNEKLQQRKDKAIEYIKSHKDYEDEGLLVEETKELLEILGGK